LYALFIVPSRFAIANEHRHDTMSSHNPSIHRRSLTADSDPYYSRHPNLNEVLCDRAAEPWTLKAFSSFLDHNYCAETLKFTTAVDAYRNSYYDIIGDGLERNKLVKKTFELWSSLLETYITPNAANEINIPGGVRMELLAHRDPSNPPPPDVLQVPYNLMYELLAGIFLQFTQSVEDTIQTEIDGRIPIPPVLGGHILDFPRAHGLWGGARIYRKALFRKRSSSPEGSDSTGKECTPPGSPVLKTKRIWR
jgi:hypothetical protein